MEIRAVLSLQVDVENKGVCLLAVLTLNLIIYFNFSYHEHLKPWE